MVCGRSEGRGGEVGKFSSSKPFFFGRSYLQDFFFNPLQNIIFLNLHNPLMVIQYHSQILVRVIFDNVVPLSLGTLRHERTMLIDLMRINYQGLWKNLTKEFDEQVICGTSGQKCELFRGGGQGADTRENIRRDSRAGAWEACEVGKKGRKAGEMGGNYGAILYISHS